MLVSLGIRATYIVYRMKVQPRRVSRAVEVFGTFPGAVVVRGHDWTWKDQDGWP